MARHWRPAAFRPHELQTEQLTLRPFAPGDVEAVFEACQDPEIQRWTTVPSPYTHNDAMSCARRWCTAASASTPWVGSLLAGDKPPGD